MILYRKFKAKRIFTGHELLAGGKVLITNTYGEIIDIIDAIDAGDDVETFKGILTPGFINCHCHLELSHLKNFIPEKTGLVDFVFAIVTGRHFAEKEILAAIDTAADEMIANGIVAVGDICNTGFTIEQKRKSGLWYRNFIEAAGFPPAIAEQRFQRALDLCNSFDENFPANSIVPHAPYSVSKELFQLINVFPANDIITIHNQESAAENELFKNRQGDLLRMFEKMNIDISFFKPSGRTSLQTFLPSLQKIKSLLLVHNVYTNSDDIQFANSTFASRDAGLYYCFCPNANLYIGDQLPAVNDFIDRGCNIVLGTDSLASNKQLSILEEIKTLHKNLPRIGLVQLLQWATINGAQALGCANIFGSFEKGKKPGIVLIKSGDTEDIMHSTAEKIL